MVFVFCLCLLLLSSFKPGLHRVVRVTEHACDNVSNWISKPSVSIDNFLVRDLYLQSLLPYRDQAIAGQLEKHGPKPMLEFFTTYTKTRL